MTDGERDISRESFERIKEKSEDDFEKSITYISAGALGLSLTFIEKIITFNNTTFVTYLVLGWILLTLTLTISLVSHMYSSWLTQKSLKEYDEENKDLPKNIDRRNRKINTVNISSVTTLLIGIGFIVFFVSQNAFDMAKKSGSETKPQKPTIERHGRTIPQPAPPPKVITPKKK